MTFVQRRIRLKVQLANRSGTNQPNTFEESGTDTVTVNDARAMVRIANSGTPSDNVADVRVYGLTPSLMNQFATLGMVFNLVPNNKLTIDAGSENGDFTNVFTGTIFAAYGDFSSQPDVPFHFACKPYAADSVINIPASSFPGTSRVADIMSGFARQMNLGFRNNGVTATLENAIYRGSARRQAEQCARDAGISWGIIDGRLEIWPLGGSRETPTIPVISPATGMIAYPAFTQQGILVKTVFNPQISFGGLIKVESTVLAGIAATQAANPIRFPTVWAVNKIDHALDAIAPRGDWMSTIYAYNPNYARTIIPQAR